MGNGHWVRQKVHTHLFRWVLIMPRRLCLSILRKNRGAQTLRALDPWHKVRWGLYHNRPIPGLPRPLFYKKAFETSCLFELGFEL